MDVCMLPPALLRSGTLELWLETRLPDADARAAIISGKLSVLPPVRANRRNYARRKPVEFTETVTIGFTAE